jgi:hypothetical protein
LVGAVVPRLPQAEGGRHDGQGTNQRGEAGYVVGRQQVLVPQYQRNPVSHEKIGSPTFGVIPAGFTGIPRTERDPHGASGAQLIGKFIHDPHPNPHARPLAISCASVSSHASAS